MVYLLLDNKKLAFALVYEKPTDDIENIKIETEEEQEKLNLKCELEYIKCLLELNNGI